MSDRIAVIDRGECVQCDTPRTLFRRPRTRFVAGFFRDCNLVEAECVGIDGDRARLRVAGTPVEIGLAGRQPLQRDRAAVAIRAESPVLGDGAERCPVVFDARILDVVYRGAGIEHVCELADGQRLVAISTREEVSPGAGAVRLGLDPESIVLLED